MRALLEAMIPPDGAFKPGATETELRPEIDAFLKQVFPHAPKALYMVVAFLEISPFFIPPFKFRRFSRLSLPDRIHILEAWEHSNWIVRRQMMHGLKMLFMSHFYAREDVKTILGCPNPQHETTDA